LRIKGVLASLDHSEDTQVNTRESVIKTFAV